MTLQQFADYLIAKFCKAANVHDVSTLNDAFIESVGASIRHSLHDYWASLPYADLPDIAFHAASLLAIQKGTRNLGSSAKIADLPRLYQKKPWQRTLANNDKTGSISSPTRSTRNRSWSSPGLHINTYRSNTTAPGATPTSSLSMPLIPPPNSDVCYEVAHNTSACPPLSRGTRIQIELARNQNRNSAEHALAITTGGTSIAHGARKEDKTRTETIIPTKILLRLIAIRASLSPSQDLSLLRKTYAGWREDVYSREQNSSSLGRAVRNPGSAECTQQSGGANLGYFR